MRSWIAKLAARFFRKVLKDQHTQTPQVITVRKVLKDQHIQTPQVITVGKNAVDSVVMEMLKADETTLPAPAARYFTDTKLWSPFDIFTILK